ncbi:hypothetical protein G210_0737 [Candida maltosa Xu316]|uniref:Uncharacterized protein n=1 Tax=Candida maltosa (strain Xu316) TaxID=1245528 RepID=M3J987_CANMX|nr:hypothetical protein G210_0737 [Candida maltosa Xu316]
MCSLMTSSSFEQQSSTNTKIYIKSLLVSNYDFQENPALMLQYPTMSLNQGISDNVVVDITIAKHDTWLFQTLFKQALGFANNTPNDHVFTEKETKLVKQYINTTGESYAVYSCQPVCDEFVPEIILLDNTGIITTCVFCIAAADISNNEFLQYYKTAISKINSHLKTDPLLCLVGTTVLCCIENRFPYVDPIHLKDAMALLDQVNDPSHIVLDFAIWNLLRMRLLRALINNTEVDKVPELNATDDSIYTTYRRVLLNVTKIWNFNHHKSPPTSSSEEYQVFFSHPLPSDFHCIIYQHDKPYPSIYFNNHIIAITNVLYKLGQIFIHEETTITTDPNCLDELILEILGIFKTYSTNYTIATFGIYILKYLSRYMKSDTEFIKLVEKMSIVSKIHI